MTSAVQGEELQTLRTELKEWEHAFSAANEGRKPSKDDIKKDPTIALKYKTYSRLRMQEKTKTRTPEHKPRKLRHQDKDESTQVLDTPSRNKLRDDASAVGTPSHPGRRHETVTTPGSKRAEVPRLHPANLDPYESPARLHQFLTPSGHLKQTPHQGTPLPLHDMLGPTPQRDGKALGLFDLLSSSSVTPSKRKRDALAQNQQTLKNKTPSSRSKLSKPQSAQESRPDETPVPRTPTSGRRHSPSPISTSKRYYLANFFATPTTRRLLASMPEDDEPLGDLGMSPLHNRTLPTPSFLRRRSSAILPSTSEADPQ
ncbi:DNA replication regulator sld2, partial [Ascosphaera atra]